MLRLELLELLYFLQARSQNFTVGVSFGAERDAAFEHAQNRCVISMPQVISLVCSDPDRALQTIPPSPNMQPKYISEFQNFHIHFSPMVLSIHLDVTLTFFGVTVFPSFHQTCITPMDEYQSLLGDGSIALICKKKIFKLAI